MKTIKAYIVSNGDPEEDTIQFATTNVAARRQGADEMGDDFSNVSCRRLPWADEYSYNKIPAKAYIEHGWYVGCLHCGITVSEHSYVEDEEGNEIPHAPIFRGYDVFCCAECEASYDSEVINQNTKFVNFQQILLKENPDLEFKKFQGKWPHMTMTAKFMFDGAKYGGTIRDEGDGVLKWFIANADISAWEEYNEARSN